jgi:periplasmic mercuric ion binding protein
LTGFRHLLNSGKSNLKENKMKTIKILIMAVVAIISTGAFAQSKTDTIKVYGNCGMCKSRIEKAVKKEGAATANWNSDTKLLVVSYDDSKVTNDGLQKAIAAVGHDTEKYAATDKAYNNLPGCCLYERKTKGK